MSQPQISVGPFRLLHPIGEGGMAQVWRAAHAVWEVEVAVKVLTGERARDPRAMQVFRREVQAVAALDHPGIIRVFDVGSISAEAEEQSRGALAQGSPFFAMELLSGDTLRTRKPSDWKATKVALLTVLEALAHAHARGVVHRDLKPDNVLVDLGPGAAPPPSGAETPRVLLSDFGIAHLLEASASPDEAGRTAGTPSYMAPEQLQAFWRDYGPWTDLYALGCLAYELLCGAPPFTRASTLATIEAHLYDPRPSLQARFPVPAQLETWLHQMLAVDPNQRFTHARDAAAALSSMPDQGLHGAHAEPTIASELSLPTQEISATQPPEPPGRAAPTATTPTPLPKTDEGALPPSPPVLGTTRAQPTLARASEMRLRGAGLGLFGLRPIPLVDRDGQREALWNAFADMLTHRRAECLVLQGAPGTGKRRLSQWLAHAGSELGLAADVGISLAAGSNAEDALARLLATHLRCLGLTRMEMYNRTYRYLAARGMEDPRGLAMAAAQLMTPFAAPSSGADPLPDIPFGSSEARYSVARRVLGWICRRRPLIVVARHAQHGEDFLEFVSHVLAWQSQRPIPLLVVLTCDEDADAIPGRCGPKALRKLCRRPHVHTVPVSQLADLDHRELVERLLMLEPALAQRIAKQTGESPLFAVQLVGDWVERGLLAPTRDGFVLADHEPTLPRELHAVWADRVDALCRAVDAPSETVWQALEAAAILGAVVEQETWQTVCVLCNAAIPAGLLDVLLTRGLAEPVDALGDVKSWSFSHPMLRDVLVQRARATGRWEQTTRAYVQHLRGRYDREQPDVVDRLASALLEAGEHEEAAATSLDAARAFVATGEVLRAMGSLDRLEDALMASDIPMSDRRWSDGWRVRAAAHLHEHALDDAQQAIDQAMAHAHLHDATVAAELSSLQGQLALARGDVNSAMPAFEDAIAAYHQLGAPLPLAECLVAVGGLFLDKGKIDRATMYFEGALELYEGEAEVAGMADALAGLASMCHANHDLPTAHELLTRALSYAEKGADRLGLAQLLRQAADVAHAQGAAEEAQAHLQQSIRLAEELGARRELVWALATWARWTAAARDWPGLGQRLIALTSLAEGALDGMPHAAAELNDTANIAGMSGEMELARQAGELATRLSTSSS